MSNARTLADYANDDGISGNKIDGGTATPATLSGSILNSTKLASSGTSIYKSNGSTAVISESSGTATLNNVTLGSSVNFGSIANDSISGDKIHSGTISNSALATTVTMSANHPAVKTALNASGSAPVYACRAWVSFLGTSVTNPASTAGINASGNVSTLFDNGAGDYTVNFETAMPDANYVVAGATSDDNRHQRMIMCKADSVSNGSVRIGIVYNDGGALTDDTGHVMIAIFR